MLHRSALRPAPVARRAAPALAALAALALAAASAGAQTRTMTFDGLTAVDASGVRYVSNCYEEAGFRVTLVGAACGADAALATWTPDNDLYYAGSPALYNNLGESVDFTATGGQTFAFQSIGLAPFLGQLGNPTSVLFTGFLASGGMVTQSVDVAGGVYGQAVAATPYSFANFGGLRALRLTVTAPSTELNVQFDDVTFALGPAATVPEPATVALVAGGLAGVAALARRRRGATA